LLKVDAELSMNVKRANSSIEASGIGFISSMYSLTSMEIDDDILKMNDSDRNTETFEVFNCKTCSDEFKEKMEFISHANFVHSKIFLLCSQCAALKVYMKIQHSCDQCSVNDCSKDILKKHK